jgi:hypothetical protein
MIDDGDCGAIGGMRIGRGNRRSKGKPALVPLCPPQIPRDLTRARTQAAADYITSIALCHYFTFELLYIYLGCSYS